MNQIAALVITRKHVGFAVFLDRTLNKTELQRLPDAPEMARQGIQTLIRWLADNYGLTNVALRLPDRAYGLRLESLLETAVHTCRGLGIPIWEVKTAELFQAFGLPALLNRFQLGRVCMSLWPFLNSRQATVLEAAALGLYVQVERLLNI